MNETPTLVTFRIADIDVLKSKTQDQDFQFYYPMISTSLLVVDILTGPACI